VGDFNGDGFDDFVLSNDGSLIINNLKSEILSKVITTQLPFGSIEGRYVLLYLGGQLFDLKNPDAIIFKHNRSRDRNSQFGKAVAGADLIGNDGRNDLIISDPAIHDQPFERSEVYVIRGRSFPTGQRPYVIWMNGGEGQIAASAVSDQLISVPAGAAKTLISNFNFDQDVGNYKEIAFSLANGGVVMLKGSPTGFENLPEYQYFNGSDSSFGTALAASQIDTVHSGDDLLIGEPASGNGQVYLVKSSASGWLTNYNSGALGSPDVRANTSGTRAEVPAQFARSFSSKCYADR
jgi:hypothetical protein